MTCPERNNRHRTVQPIRSQCIGARRNGLATRVACVISFACLSLGCTQHESHQHESHQHESHQHESHQHESHQHESHQHESQLWSAAPVSLQVDRIAGAPVVIDLNHDGHVDILAPHVGAADDTGLLTTFLGDGRGGFTRSNAPVEVGFRGAHLKLSVGDVNEDGHMDAVVGHHDSYDLVILFGDGRGGFVADKARRVASHDGKKPHTHSVALADMNRDRHLDILTTCADDNAVAVLLGSGDGDFTPAPGSPFAAGRQPYEGLSVGDLNDDDNPDVVVPNLWGSAVCALLGDGKGHFELAPDSPLPLGPRPGYVNLGHLNDDQLPDLVVTHDDDPVVDILLGDSKGSLKVAAGSPVRVGQLVWIAVIEDVNCDSANDIVLGGRTDSVLVLFGDGHGGVLAEPRVVFKTERTPGYVRLADFNSDRRLDLVVTGFDGGVIDVYLSRTAPSKGDRK